MPYVFFIQGGGGGSFQKITLMRGGGGQEKKIGNWGGVIQFSNYTPPNSTSPPYPIKNERSLILMDYGISCGKGYVLLLRA